MNNNQFKEYYILCLYTGNRVVCSLYRVHGAKNVLHVCLNQTWDGNGKWTFNCMCLNCIVSLWMMSPPVLLNIIELQKWKKVRIFFFVCRYSCSQQPTTHVMSKRINMNLHDSLFATCSSSNGKKERDEE